MEANSHSARPAGVAEGRQPSVERALSHGGLPRIGSTESQQHNGPAGDHPRKRLPAKQTSRSFSDLSRCGHRLAAAAGAQKLGGCSGAVRTRPRWVRADLGSQQAASSSAPQAAVWRPCVALHAVRRRLRLQRHRQAAHYTRCACRVGPGQLYWLFPGACDPRKALLRSVQSRASWAPRCAAAGHMPGQCCARLLSLHCQVLVLRSASSGSSARAVRCPGERVPALILPFRSRSTVPATVTRSVPRAPPVTWFAWC